MRQEIFCSQPTRIMIGLYLLIRKRFESKMLAEIIIHCTFIYVDGTLFSLNFSWMIITVIIYFPFSVLMPCRTNSRNESDCSWTLSQETYINLCLWISGVDGKECHGENRLLWIRIDNLSHRPIENLDPNTIIEYTINRQWWYSSAVINLGTESHLGAIKPCATSRDQLESVSHCRLAHKYVTRRTLSNVCNSSKLKPIIDQRYC